MKYYIQYDETSGAIKSIISADKAPQATNQIESSVFVDPNTSKVDLVTKKIVSTPAPTPSPQEMILKRVQEACSFGALLIQEYGVKNILRGYQDDQILEIATQLSQVMALLQAGALTTAKVAITELEETEFINKADKDYFVARIEDFLRG